MKCKNCKYNNHIKYPYTTMTTCEIKLYVITKLNKEGWNIYMTDALVSQEDECYIIKAIKKYLKS